MTKIHPLDGIKKRGVCEQVPSDCKDKFGQFRFHPSKIFRPGGTLTPLLSRSSALEM